MVLNMKRLKSYCQSKLKKELIECVITKGIIKQEEVIDYDLIIIELTIEYMKS